MASGAASVTGLRNRDRNRNRANFHIIQITHQQQPSREDLQRSPWCLVFVFVIQVLGNVVQLHFHDSSPFDAHAANMGMFLLALLIYCIALGYYVKYCLAGSGRFRNICDQVGYVSGSLACAALISVVVPPPLELSVFAIWMVASIMFVDATRCWILEMAQKLYHLAMDVVSQVNNIWVIITGVINNRRSIATGAV